MDACFANRIHAGDVLTNRRTVLGALIVAGLAMARNPASILSQEATPPALPIFMGETFVGETSDPETFVAVVLGGTAGAAPREARGYLCNGLARSIDVWLIEEAEGGLPDLAAGDGSRLTGVLTAAGIGGGATVPDGSGLVFTAVPATGLIGLYTVAMLPEGRMEGASAAGATFVGMADSRGGAGRGALPV